MMQEEAISALEKNIPSLSERDQQFAISLVTQYHRRGSLSPRQWPWVQTLSTRKPQEPEKLSGNLVPMVTMFRLAQDNGKKSPSVIFLWNDQKIRISAAKENSRNPGWWYIKVDGAYGGKIEPKTGEIIRTQACPDDILDALNAFSEDPVQAGKAFAAKTGCCSWCERELTDDRSKQAGYGPICAKKHGLPWG